MFYLFYIKSIQNIIRVKIVNYKYNNMYNEYYNTIRWKGRTIS
jgi:hypothetical protein